MAVRAALCSFIADPDFKENDERSKAAKEQVRKLLQIITEDDSRQNRFDILVVKRLEKCFFSCVSTEVCRSKLVKREKTLCAFLSPQLPRTGSNAAEPCTRSETVFKQN